jgi:hypothetical protein
MTLAGQGEALQGGHAQKRCGRACGLYRAVGGMVMGRMAMSMGVLMPMIVLVYARRAVHQPALT